jgi:hypothetical protein
MTHIIMRGGTALREYISNFLASAVPGTVDVMREHYGLDEYQLPYPVKYDAIDPTLIGNDEYPAMGCVVLNDRNHIREDVSPTAELIYSAIYSVRFVVIARTPKTADGGWEEQEKATAIRLRDDLTRCLHHVLLQTPSLGQPDFIKMNEVTMTTDYLEPSLINTQSKRWFAASLVTAEIAFTESTWLTAIGTADTVTIQGIKLTP